MQLSFFCVVLGADKSAYFHEFFLRGKPSLVDCIRAVKNDSLRKISAPNFYKLPFLPPSIIPRVCGPESSIQYQPQQKQLSTTPFSLRPGSSDRDRSNEMRSMDASAALERASRLQTWAKPTSNLVGLIPVAATNFDQLRSLAPQSVEGAAVMNTINTSSSSLLRENGLVTPEGFTRRDVHRALVSEFVMNNLPREQICRSRSDTADPSSYPPPTQPASMSAPQMQQVRAANNLLFHPGTSTTALYGRLGGPTSLSLTVAMDPKGQTGTTTTTTAREFELLRLQASMMLGGNAIKRSPAIALNSMQLLPINNFNDRTSQGCSILENAIDSGSMDLALQLCQEKLDSMDTASRNWLLQQIRRGQ